MWCVGGQFMLDVKREIYLICTKHLLNKLKHQEAGILCFFSDEKNFDQNRKVNWKNNRWLYRDLDQFTIVMYHKFPSTVMVQGVMSNERDVIPPQFFFAGFKSQCHCLYRGVGESCEVLNRQSIQQKTMHLPTRLCTIS